MALNRRIGRDAVTWIALGLVVASILIVTTRHAAATKLGAKKQTSVTAQPRSSLRSRARAARDSRPGGPQRREQLVAAAPSTSTTAVSSTTTTIPSVTSTTTANALATITTRATLSYPGDVATTYPLSVASGPVSARLVWQEGSGLSLALTCGRAAVARSSARGLIAVVLPRVSGGCDLRIARNAMAGRAISYALTLSYLATNTAG